jgi:hypothetical protein
LRAVFTDSSNTSITKKSTATKINLKTKRRYSIWQEDRKMQVIEHIIRGKASEDPIIRIDRSIPIGRRVVIAKTIETPLIIIRNIQDIKMGRLWCDLPDIPDIQMDKDSRLKWQRWQVNYLR